MYFFFDTETTGLSKNSDHIVQIAWIVANEDGDVLSEKEFIIRPDGFTIPTQAALIHGITTRRALDEGVPIADALEELLSDTEDVACVVAHNAQFDLAILRRECIDNDYAFPFDGVLPICTMRSSTQYCRLAKLNGANGYKWPTLEELHFHLFGAYFDGAHDAMADVQACMKCFFALIEQGVLDPPRTKTSSLHPSQALLPNTDRLRHKIKVLTDALEEKQERIVELEARIAFLESEDGLFELAAKSKNVEWRRFVASDPNCPAEILEALSDDATELSVIVALASNPRATQYVFQGVYGWYDVGFFNRYFMFLSGVRENASNSADLVEFVGQALRDNPSCPPDIRDELVEFEETAQVLVAIIRAVQAGASFPDDSELKGLMFVMNQLNELDRNSILNRYPLASNVYKTEEKRINIDNLHIMQDALEDYDFCDYSCDNFILAFNKISEALRNHIHCVVCIEFGDRFRSITDFILAVNTEAVSREEKKKLFGTLKACIFKLLITIGAEDCEGGIRELMSKLATS